MPAALYRFTAKERSEEYEKCVADFMGYRFFNGQIKSLEWISYWRENYFCVACETFWERSLDKILFSRAAEKQNYEELLRLSAQEPEYELLSYQRDYEKNQWTSYEKLIIYGSTDKEKCIYGNSFRSPIWIDTLPDEFNRYELVDWNLSFSATYADYLYGFSRDKAYQEIVSCDSELNKRGRKIAENIGKFSGKSTYYCLFDITKVDFDARKDKCPSCGSKWYGPTKKKAKGLDTFEYCCHCCLLLKAKPTTRAQLQHRGYTKW